LIVHHVIVDLNFGGAEFMLKRLIESHASDTGIQHSVISLTDFGKIGPQLVAQGIQVTALNMRGFLGMPKALYSLYRIFIKSKPDIVQTWMYHSDLLGGLAARLAGIENIIWGVRTTELAKSGNRATVLVRKTCAFLSRYIPKVIVCAAEASRRIHVAIGYDDKRMIVIPNGFDVVRLTATAEQRYQHRALLEITAEELVVGSLGRFNPVKDHANFIAAAGMLAPKYPRLRFLLVGRDLDQNNMALKQHIDATGHADRFILLGERQDVPVCLKAMDIFCLHSRTEGFPNVLGEAMTMGLPCVATDVGDAAYLVGDTGIVVPSKMHKH